MQCEVRYKISVKAGKGVFHMIPVHVFAKNTRNLYRFFFLPLSTENTSTRSLVPSSLCSTLTRAAMLLVLSSCSNKNDGPCGRFNCVSIVACKGSVCEEVLTSFYGRFFVEVGQFHQLKVPPHRPST